MNIYLYVYKYFMGNLKLTWDTISTCKATLFILNNGTDNPFNDAL